MGKPVEKPGRKAMDLRLDCQATVARLLKMEGKKLSKAAVDCCRLFCFGTSKCWISF
jgi:hypothetical protein